MMRPDGIKKAYEGLMHWKAMIELGLWSFFMRFLQKHYKQVTDGYTEGQTDGRTHAHIEMRGRI